LSYPRVSALLGAVPRITPLVADTTGTLRSADHKRINRELVRLQKRFPQIVPQVVMHRFPAAHPFSMHAFWLFNAADFAGASRRGRDNHSLMLAIDPFRGEAAIVPGYGLESFLTSESLGRLLDLAGPLWRESRWTEGVLHVFEELGRLLETVAVVQGADVQGDF
jgi:uncharacterized membrane protein YgcG